MSARLSKSKLTHDGTYLPPDYMAYPNRDHGLREGKGTAVHLRLLMTRLLTEHLPPGPR